MRSSLSRALLHYATLHYTTPLSPLQVLRVMRSSLSRALWCIVYVSAPHYTLDLMRMITTEYARVMGVQGSSAGGEGGGGGGGDGGGGYGGGGGSGSGRSGKTVLDLPPVMWVVVPALPKGALIEVQVMATLL
jgi:uncharacterized membrane protein YgcG